jgi:PAS domain S-box-containing protein
MLISFHRDLTRKGSPVSWQRKTALLVGTGMTTLCMALFMAAVHAVSGLPVNDNAGIPGASGSLLSLAGTFLFLGLAITAGTLLVLNKKALSPIGRLIKAVGETRRENGGVDVSKWAPRKEFAELGDLFSGLFTVLDQSQKAWQASVLRFHSLIENTPLLAIQGITGDGTITSWNGASTKLWGYGTDEALGFRLHELLAAPDSAERLRRDLEEVWLTGKPVSPREWAIRTKSGDKRWVYSSFFPILKGEEVSEVFCMQVDITDRKSAEEKIALTNEELQNMNEQLELTIRHAQQLAMEAQIANVAKSEFLARMSHEIRTPMNGIIGFSDMLLMSPMNEEQTEYAQIIRRSGETLLTLIDEILDFSKIEAGQMELESVDFDPEVVAYDVCDLIRPRVQDKPIEVLCRISDNVPTSVLGDPSRFRQVLLNLMGNAAKFTEQGEIELSVDIDEESEERIRIHARVRDTGIGIPRDKQGTIFEAFQQSGRFITRKYGGTGLGLAICRQLSHLMDGNVWVESVPGEQTVFHFTAWLGKGSESPPRVMRPFSLKGKKVLVVDDNKANLDIMQHMLTASGLQVQVLDAGETVLTTLEMALKAASPFDLCILDIQMPDMSGYEVAETIRRQPPPLCRIPLLAFSSSTNQNGELFRKAGFNAFLPKPVRSGKLTEMLSRILGENGNAVEGEPEKLLTMRSLKEEAKRSVRILLVEDNPANQKLAQLILAKAGYQVEAASNGREAINRFFASPDQYDMILMDVQMPEMDGLRATRAIRKRGFGDVPIVAMTANAMKGDREKCIEAGMNDYIAKPVRRENVYEMIRKWVTREAEIVA